MEPLTLAAIGCLAVATDTLDERLCEPFGRLSSCHAAFRREQNRLMPIEVHEPDLLDDDLLAVVKIPQRPTEVTRLLINVTLASLGRSSGGAVSILDPMCGPSTTLSTAIMLAYNATGVEVDPKAVEVYAAYPEHILAS
jgi:hypothetical protein